MIGDGFPLGNVACARRALWGATTVVLSKGSTLGGLHVAIDSATTTAVVRGYQTFRINTKTSGEGSVRSNP